jgi:hypothetical protein
LLCAGQLAARPRWVIRKALGVASRGQCQAAVATLPVACSAAGGERRAHHRRGRRWMWELLGQAIARVLVLESRQSARTITSDISIADVSKAGVVERSILKCSTSRERVLLGDIGLRSQQVYQFGKSKSVGLHRVTMLTFTRGLGAEPCSHSASKVDEYIETEADRVIFALLGEGLPRRSIWSARRHAHGHLVVAAFPTPEGTSNSASPRP